MKGLKNLFLIFFCFFLISFSFGHKREELDKIFQKCEQKGEQMKNFSFNCSIKPPDEFLRSIDSKLNKFCIEGYALGCRVAKVKEFCDQGVKDLIEGKINNCQKLVASSNFQIGQDYYELCCNVCGRGFRAQKNKELCEKRLPDSNFIDLYVQNQFEYCCKTKLNRTLSTDLSENNFELFPDSIREELEDLTKEATCEKLKCEHRCYVYNQKEEKCSCEKGFKLNVDDLHCDDIDECSKSPCKLDEKCINYVGGYECVEKINSRSNFKFRSYNSLSNRLQINLIVFLISLPLSIQVLI